MAEPAHVAHQFDTMPQQREAATLGMWVFLATEVMLFSGLFTGYAALRWLHRPAWIEGSRHMDLVLGAVNTAVLIVSSLVVALAVTRAQAGRGRATAALLWGAAGLGALFLAIKGVEYAHHFQAQLVPGIAFAWEGPGRDELALFFWLYFVMTGLHALHVAAGIGVLAVIGWLAWRGWFSAAYHTPVEVGGLYWHLVDVIWVFLFPLLYLVE